MSSLSEIDDTKWQILSAYGAVFLPISGYYGFKSNSFSYNLEYIGNIGVSLSSLCNTCDDRPYPDVAFYWCGDTFSGDFCLLHFSTKHIDITSRDPYRLMYDREPDVAFAVRLVQDVK